MDSGSSVNVIVRGVDDDLLRQVQSVIDGLLAGTSGLADLTLGRTCSHVLIESAKALRLKNAEHRILSTTTVFLISYLMARGLASVGHPLNDMKTGGELEQLRQWGEALRGRFSEALEKIAHEFFEQIPIPDLIEFEELPDADQVGPIELGPGLERILRRLSDLRVVNITDILLASLEDEESGLAARVSRHDIHGLADTLRIAARKRGGGITQMVREARDDELALGVMDYAVALSTIFRTAQAEFTFALFGSWGSGKTTLTRLLAPLLTSPEIYRETAQAEDITSSRRTYSVVCHNAWKHRAPPEAWIYLYKSLVDEAQAGLNGFEKVLLAARTSFNRSGPWPIVGALLALAILAIPLKATLQLVAIAGSVVGVAALAHVAAISPKVQAKIGALYARHARLSAKSESLGMLALIGDDIRALLAAWTSPLEDDPDERREGFPIGALRLPLSVILVFALVWLFGLFTQTFASSIPFFLKAHDALSLFLPSNWLGAYRALTTIEARTEVAPLGDWLLLFAWLGRCATFLVLPWTSKRSRPNRVLLVVDDLDRCAPEEMLNVIESLKLLVDDPIVNKRMQVMMLVDEGVLAHAIASRYEQLIEDRISHADDTQLDDARRAARCEVIAEQNEKLFACHMRVAPLSDVDVGAVVVRLTSRELDELRQRQRLMDELRLRRQMSAARVELVNAEVIKDAAQTALDAGDHVAEGLRSTAETRIALARRVIGRLRVVESPQGESENAAPTSDTADVRFTSHEVDELQRLVPIYFHKLERRASPRAIKILLFKIQLCRLLLQLRLPGQQAEERSIRMILRAFERSAGSDLDDERGDEVLKIARQVV